MTLWLDVEDLFRHAARHDRPSGIQRLSLEIAAALHAAFPDRIGFLRADGRGGGLRAVRAEAVLALRNTLSVAPRGRKAVPRRDVTDASRPARMRWLPGEIRAPLGMALRSQRATLRALGTAVGAAPALWRRTDTRSGAPMLRRDDAVASFGAPWAIPGHAAALAQAADAAAARLAWLVHDCIPLSRPEFCDGSVVAQVEAFARDAVPRATHVLTTSRATAEDLEQWMARRGIALRSRPVRVPIGTGFDAVPAPTLPHGLAQGGYVLVAGTLEIRKNHMLAFRVWQRLLATMPSAAVPRLVFAGRIGWMIEPLLRAIEATRGLGGHLVVVDAPSDADMAALYRGCRFSLFPSHAEGWGLPVSESLACGRPCIASGHGAMVEAGGEFCLYIDPDDITGALGVIRSAIEEPARIDALAARIAAEYRARPWSESAASVMGLLG